VDGLANAVR
jgi:protocatechuate 3,4-dioxygenase beta subunit